MWFMVSSWSMRTTARLPVLDSSLSHCLHVLDPLHKFPLIPTPQRLWRNKIPFALTHFQDMESRMITNTRIWALIYEEITMKKDPSAIPILLHTIALLPRPRPCHLVTTPHSNVKSCHVSHVSFAPAQRPLSPSRNHPSLPVPVCRFPSGDPVRRRRRRRRLTAPP